jgi:cellulose synthase/poly-beta-1,6-N-acetylglucosamine synthase-like glycosyltransferase
MWITALLLCGLAAYGVQLWFWAFVFRAWRSTPLPPKAKASQKGVSVIVCAHNEAEKLPRLLAALATQHHPAWELVLVNDRSTDGTAGLCKAYQQSYPHCQVLHIHDVPAGLNPKKHALSQGIAAARYEVLLLTDADCCPASPDWIREMSAPFALPQIDFVLGVSPYEENTGWLNRLIQYETFYTALQYICLAQRGYPYMGVGRNLAYRKRVFVQQGGFLPQHQALMGGDDDLLVGYLANTHNTATVIAPTAFTYSLPPHTWQAWIRQKTRHLSVGKYYKPAHSLRLGALHLSQLLVLFVNLTAFPYFWYDGQKIYLFGLLMIYCLRLVIFVKASHKPWRSLQSQTSSAYLPILALLYLFYLWTTGIVAMISKRTQWN